jgi:hypothetical protein
MAGPAYYSITMNISQNDDWVVPFIYQSQDASGNVAPIDLSNSTLKLEMRVNESDHEAIVECHSPDGGIWITDAVNGCFTIAIDRESRLWRLVGGYQYTVDLVRLVASNGFQERIFEGTAFVVEGTTR